MLWFCLSLLKFTADRCPNVIFAVITHPVLNTLSSHSQSKFQSNQIALYWLNCGGLLSYCNANMPYSTALYETICCKINPPFLPPPCVIDILARSLYLLSLESEKVAILRWWDARLCSFGWAQLLMFPLTNLEMRSCYAYDGAPYRKLMNVQECHESHCTKLHCIMFFLVLFLLIYIYISKPSYWISEKMYLFVINC